jgi:hypothetical protein
MRENDHLLNNKFTNYRQNGLYFRGNFYKNFTIDVAERALRIAGDLNISTSRRPQNIRNLHDKTEGHRAINANQQSRFFGKFLMK